MKGRRHMMEKSGPVCVAGAGNGLAHTGGWLDYACRRAASQHEERLNAMALSVSTPCWSRQLQAHLGQCIHHENLSCL